MANYRIEKFDIHDLVRSNSKILIPNFQRGLVWNSSRQKEFIKTIKRRSLNNIVNTMLFYNEAQMKEIYLK